MPEKYHINNFIVGGEEPQEGSQRFLAELFFMIKARLSDALCDPNTGLSDAHPRVLISIIVSNVLVNLLFNSVIVTDVQRRLEMLQETMDEISEMTFQLWCSLEAGRANTTIAP